MGVNPEDFAVEIQDLTYSYGKVAALRELTLTVARGQIFGLVGPDGAGKTTTLRTLAGLLPPTSGTARVMGIDTRDAEPLRDRIGYLAQRFALYGDLSVWENVCFFADVYGVTPRDRDARANELLAMAGMEPFRERAADQLSGGMKQKLALTCALIHRPEVLLLDEPTAGVDPVSRRDLWRILYRLQSEGLTVLLSTAYMDEAERCHRVGLLSYGRLIADGTPDELRARLPGTIVEIVLRNTTPALLRQARDSARQLPGVTGAQLFGDSLHVVVTHPEQVEALQASLADHVPVASATRAEPTMEDIFLALRDGAA